MPKAIMQKPFIYTEDLRTGDIVAIISYSILTAGIFLVCNICAAETKQVALIFYTILTQLFLFLFLYQSLRNFMAYLVWFGLGLVHLIMFFIFKEDVELKMLHGKASSGLLNTIPLLLLFQLLRYFSLTAQHREFVAPSRGSTNDLFENRKVSFADYTVFIIYMAVCFGLFVIDTLI